MSAWALKLSLALALAGVGISATRPARAGEVINLACTGTETIPTKFLNHSPSTTSVAVDDAGGTITVVSIKLVIEITNRTPAGFGFEEPVTVPGYSGNGVIFGFLNRYTGDFGFQVIPPGGGKPSDPVRTFYQLNNYKCQKAAALF